MDEHRTSDAREREEDRHDDGRTEVHSINRKGEDAADEQEAGRHDTGDQGPTNRPTGESTARDVTGVDPQDSITSPGRTMG